MDETSRHSRRDIRVLRKHYIQTDQHRVLIIRRSANPVAIRKRNQEGGSLRDREACDEEEKRSELALILAGLAV